MSSIRGTNITIFILFFGITLLEAIQEGKLLKAASWITIGVVFLLADILKKKTADN
jgi:hypothetical protein